MAKQINFEHEGTDYTLEFTRSSVSSLEKKGFIIGEISDKPMNVLPDLFAGAFVANHKYVKREKIDKIFDGLEDKDSLIEKLVEMYHEPLKAMLDDSEEIEAKKISWNATGWK